MTITIKPNERGFLIVDETKVTYLEPGKHNTPFFGTSRIVLADLTKSVPHDDWLRAVIPSEDMLVVELKVGERAFMLRGGVPNLWMKPLAAPVAYWNVERENPRDQKSARSRTMRRIDVSQTLLEPLPKFESDLIPKDEYQEFTVSEGHVGIHSVDGKFSRVLRPGKYAAFSVQHQVSFAAVADGSLGPSPVADNIVAQIGEADSVRVNLGHNQRAFLEKGGVAVKWLGAGAHAYWNTTGLYSIRSVDISGSETTPLLPQERSLVANGDYEEVTVPAGMLALKYVDGVFQGVLQPGRYASFAVTHQISFVVVEARRRLIQVVGQEVMTKDRVSLRVNLAAAVELVDAVRVATVAEKPDEQIYLAMQMAARDAISSRTLDELLADRETATQSVTAPVASCCEALGYKLVQFGLKDVVLPGEMRTLLNRVIEAQKEAEANVITRREEIAAVRSMAQTAKVYSENPLLMRLKELDMYRDVSSKVGTMHVVLGDGATKLELKS